MGRIKKSSKTRNVGETLQVTRTVIRTVFSPHVTSPNFLQNRAQINRSKEVFANSRRWSAPGEKISVFHFTPGHPPPSTIHNFELDFTKKWPMLFIPSERTEKPTLSRQLTHANFDRLKIGARERHQRYRRASERMTWTVRCGSARKCSCGSQTKPGHELHIKDF